MVLLTCVRRQTTHIEFSLCIYHALRQVPLCTNRIKNWPDFSLWTLKVRLKWSRKFFLDSSLATSSIWPTAVSSLWGVSTSGSTSWTRIPSFKSRFVTDDAELSRPVMGGTDMELPILERWSLIFESDGVGRNIDGMTRRVGDDGHVRELGVVMTVFSKGV
jgi:hypothetical protein